MSKGASENAPGAAACFMHKHRRRGCRLYRRIDAAAHYHKLPHYAQSGPHSLLTHRGTIVKKGVNVDHRREPTGLKVFFFFFLLNLSAPFIDLA